MRVLRSPTPVEEKILASAARPRSAMRSVCRTNHSRTCDGAATRRCFLGRSASMDWHCNARNVWVTRDELRSASRKVSAAISRRREHAARNIRAVARRQKPQEWTLDVEPGVRASQRVRPIESVGCYLPGGRFSLVSTLLMTAIPAQEAGVRQYHYRQPATGRTHCLPPRKK